MHFHPFLYPEYDMNLSQNVITFSSGKILPSEKIMEVMYKSLLVLKLCQPESQSHLKYLENGTYESFGILNQECNHKIF